MTASTSFWSPLRHRPYRGLWSGGGIYFIGNAMQTMATAWLMVEITGSSLLAALVQTAVFLPMFLLALPSGVLADTTDRRTLIVRGLATHVATVLLLATLVAAGAAGPGVLLLLTFVAGCCTALVSPSWNSSIVDSVPREDLPQAITGIAIAFNAARALGPAAAGVVFARAGAGWVFGIALACILVMLHAIHRWPPRPHPSSRLPAERLWGGTLAALRYARHSEIILAQLVRTVAFGATGSALWALLPVIGQRQLGLGAQGFGVLMACLGGGAVAAGLVVGQLRVRLGLDRLVAGSCLVFALVMGVAALATSPWAVYAALLVGGAAWMATMSTFNTATQTSAPPWVRSRAAAMHTLSALGSFALGSALWGVVSALAGLSATLGIAAVCMAAGVLLVRPFPLRMGAASEVTPATTPWDELFVAAEPQPEAGPVAVEIGYRIRPEDTEAFLEAVTQLRAPRRRDGATFWRVYRDLADPSRFAERFIVTSWADYLHQRARATLADQALEERVRSFMLPGEAVRVQHFLAER